MSKRRRFQPPLTSFLPIHSGNSFDSRNTKLHQHDPVSPSLTTSYSASLLQPSLLTVGMRIRKSVPEGYKTRVSRPKAHTGLDEPAFFVGSENCQSPHSSGLGDTTPYSTATDLIPYCGLHQVGGLVQVFPSVPEKTVPTIARVDDEAVLTPPSSQGSTSSSQLYSTAPNTNRKRRARAFDLDDHDVDSRTAFSDCEIRNPLATPHPSTYPYSHTCMPDLTAFSSPPMPMRTFAQPSSRIRKKTGVEIGSSGRLTQESFSTALGDEGNRVSSQHDFGEAAFLKPLEDVEMSEY